MLVLDDIFTSLFWASNKGESIMKREIVMLSSVVVIFLFVSTAHALRDVGDAIDWAETQKGSTNWVLKCFVFVRSSYNEGPVSGVGSAIDGWNNNSGVFGDRETDDPDDVPEGALVFFGASSANLWYGHVGLCIGEGKMIHAWTSKVQEDDIEIGGSFLGWRWPDAWTDDEPQTGLPDLDVSHVKGLFAGESSWRKELVIYQHQIKNIQIETKIDNDGKAEADKDKFEIEYYFSTDRDFDPDKDKKIGEDSVNYDLEPEGEDDDSDTEEMEISSSDSRISAIKNPGVYYFFVHIDSELEEEHKSNNTSDDDSGSDEYVRVTVLRTPTPPVANFWATPTSGNNPLTVAFADQSANNPASWLWSFGDGDISVAMNPIHLYTETGTFTVTLTVSNADGSDSETKTGYIVVSVPPSPGMRPGNLRIVQ